MKHFEEDLDDDAALREDNLWAYEGVVVPGGRLILGRWWSANDEVPDFNVSSCMSSFLPATPF
jgi:hypothetical protein